MKLTVLGGGGVRAPLLAKSIANRAKHMSINEITFMDIDDEKLHIYGELSKRIAAKIDPDIHFHLTTDPAEALRNADFIITTLRVGQDKGRILDEKIALRHGVLGQETTGAGGFAMAMRSILALVQYCEMARQYAKPSAPIFNFTNPSGLVTQALRDQGFDNVYGICDGPSGFIRELESLLGLERSQLSVECFGLNHLSWFRSVKHAGKELVDSLIDNDALYQQTEMRLFSRELVKNLHMLLNSYLYYYYNREQAIFNIHMSEATRGEMIAQINKEMLERLQTLDFDRDFDEAVSIFETFTLKRERSYMAIESGTTQKACRKTTLNRKEKEDGGYAAVALQLMEAFITGRESEMVLSVPNDGAIYGFQNDDIVEVTCKIDKAGAVPIKIGKIPEPQFSLMKTVKLYERLASEAIINKSMQKAKMALMVHPLVNSYTLAELLVEDYVAAHAKYIGEWH